MAHKELISKYAKQLAESHQRILELEIAVADAHMRLGDAKEGGISNDNDAASEIAALHILLDEKEQSIKVLNTQVQALEGAKASDGAAAIMAETRLKETKDLVKDLEKDLANRRLEIESFRQQAMQAENLAMAEANKAREARQQVSALQSATAASADEVTRLKAYAKSLEGCKDSSQRAEELQRAMTKLQGSLADARGRADKALRDKGMAQTMTAQTTQAMQGAQAEIQRLKANLSACIKEITPLKNRLEEAERATIKAKEMGVRNTRIALENGRLKRSMECLKRKHDSTTHHEVVAAKEEVAELEEQLEREKKRRMEAVAMLGPDGKRCKKCNPVVVDLMDEDEAEGGESVGG